MFVLNRMLACTVVLVAGLGCKGKPTHREAPSNADLGAGSSNAVGSGSAAHDFPKGDGTPPRKTTGPLSAAINTKLRGLSFPGFNTKVEDTRPDTVTVMFHTNERPKLKATVQIQPCDTTCIPLEVARWEHLDSLKEFLPADLSKASDTTFEVEETELNGAAMIGSYQAAMATTESGTKYSDAYVLYYNDGSNKIRVVAMYADNKPDSREHMLKLAPKEDLEQLAKSFMDVYTQAWVE